MTVADNQQIYSSMAAGGGIENQMQIARMQQQQQQFQQQQAMVMAQQQKADSAQQGATKGSNAYTGFEAQGGTDVPPGPNSDQLIAQRALAFAQRTGLDENGQQSFMEMVHSGYQKKQEMIGKQKQQDFMDQYRTDQQKNLDDYRRSTEDTRNRRLDEQQQNIDSLLATRASQLDPTLQGQIAGSKAEAAAVGSMGVKEEGAIKTDALASRSDLNILDTMVQATKGWQSGKFASVEQFLGQYGEAIGRTLGIPESAFQGVGNYAEFNKSRIVQLSTAARSLSNRVTNQEFTMLNGSIPSMDMARDGLMKVISQFQAADDVKISKLNMQQAYIAQGGTRESFDSFYMKNNLYQAALMKRMHENLDPQEFKDMVSGMKQDEAGNAFVDKALAGEKALDAYGGQ
jgi:hypothetical protein